VDDPELLVVNVVNAPTAEELEAEGAGEVAEAEEPAEESAEEAQASESESESE
jgi:large subunit ribosomal protein L25